MLPDDPRHGTEAGEAQHIRDGESPCPACRDAKLRAARRRTKRKTAGQRYTLPVGEAGYRRLATLKAKGASLTEIAAWAQLSESQVWRILAEGPETVVYARTVARIENMRPGRIITPIGVTRRLQALAHLGWSASLIAVDAGVDKATVIDARRGVLAYMSARVEAALADSFERLCMTSAPTSTPRERAAATRSQRAAERNGWAPPLAWDDIDDPAAVPSLGETIARNEVTDAIIEDAEWLDGDDLPLSTVCERLGIGRETFRQTCRRAGRVDLFARLARRETTSEVSIAVREALAAKRGAA